MILQNSPTTLFLIVGVGVSALPRRAVLLASSVVRMRPEAFIITIDNLRALKNELVCSPKI